MFKKMKDVASTRVNAAQNVADQQQLSFMKKRNLSGTASTDIYICVCGLECVRACVHACVCVYARLCV